MPSSWYLANDLQFHIIAVGIMLLYVRKPRVAVAITVLITIATTAAGYVIAAEHDLSHNLTEYMDTYYDKPWIRIPAFTIGILLGMAIRDNNKVAKLRLSTTTAFVGMSTCVCVIIFLFYIQSTRFDPKENYDRPMSALKEYWSTEDWAAYTVGLE
jgi:peptidoglycan/LPS O-acetylase OafA/YrhL